MADLVVGEDGLARCAWGASTPDYLGYHDGEWGRPVHGEHALFERYASAAREREANGGITVLVSHRFSTVRMADLIVVLDGTRVAEVGSHEELTARGGTYAELYSIQAAAYR